MTTYSSGIRGSVLDFLDTKDQMNLRCVGTQIKYLLKRRTKQKLQQTSTNNKANRKTAMADAPQQKPLHPENAPQEFGHRYRSTVQIRKRICQSRQQTTWGACAEFFGIKTISKQTKNRNFFISFKVLLK